VALDSVIRTKSDVSHGCSVPGMDVGSGRISVIQVAREPDVARETPSPAAVPRLPDARSGRRTRSPDRADLGGAGAPPAAAMGRFVAAYRWCFAFVAVL
jgi:hypothetical protein